MGSMRLTLKDNIIRCAAASFTSHVIKNFSEPETVNQRFGPYDSLIKSRLNMRGPCKAGRSTTDMMVGLSFRILSISRLLLYIAISNCEFKN